MNRTERRKAERKYGQAFSMQKYREEAIEEGRRQAIEIILTMMAYTMSYKLGFGQKRLTEIISAIMLNIDSYRTGQLTPEDYDTIKADLAKKGIKI